MGGMMTEEVQEEKGFRKGVAPAGSVVAEVDVHEEVAYQNLRNAAAKIGCLFCCSPESAEELDGQC